MRDLTNELEEKIQIKAESSRFRIQEFFIDYDRLRSGYVTKTQFQRVLDQMLNGSVSSEQIETLSEKYDTKNNSTVNYKLFLNAVNKSFPTNDLRSDPANYTFQNPEYLGTLRSMEQLSPAEEEDLKGLLSHVKNYYSKRNIDILTNFRDFDRNNIGTINESQFRRILAELPINQEQTYLLVRKYHQPDKKNSINYLNFYNEFKTSSERKSNLSSFARNTVPFTSQVQILSIQEIVDKISIACFKEGIRISDFFKDYDKLKSGLITDRQFSTALTDSVKKTANLDLDDINQLVEYYRQIDGKCDYKTFCNTIENGFNIPDMEKKPLSNVIRPLNGLLAKTLNGNLSPDEEDQIARILDELSGKVRKYNINVFPFFKDFDRSTAFTRNISKIQFGRVLAMINIMPSLKDYALLCKKFEDPVTGDINYPIFCQIIDENFINSKIDQTQYDDAGKKKITRNDFQSDITTVDVNELMARIRSHVLSDRIRIKEFFQDMDPLNSGYVNKAQFVRCLSSFGVSSIGSFNITRVQTEALCNLYKSKVDPEKVNWKRFEEEVESVFTLKNLEKNPNTLVPPTDMFVMPPPGTVSWDDEKLNSADNYKQAVDYVRNIVTQRRVDCWPPFRDFDKLNRGHVTRRQFLQCLAKLNIQITEKDSTMLEGKFTNNLGFNYVKFLNMIQPAEVDESKYHLLKKELAKLNSTKMGIYEPNPCNDIQSILAKIKDQVYLKRVSIYEWLRDHDKLNSGRIPRETFKRAINLCNLEILPVEVDMIMNYYNSIKDNQMVEYKDFWHEVENAFGKERLEKNPLLDTEQHKLKGLVESNKLLPDEEDIAQIGLAKLAERVRIQRMQLFPKFEDFDRVRNGHLSQNQFRRVLTDLSLSTIINDAELAAIMKKFFIRVGTRDDINYTSFCDKLYELGSFEYRKP